MYSISYLKFQNALKAFNLRASRQWTNDLNILLDGQTKDWFVIEKPNAAKLAEIEKDIQKNMDLKIEDHGHTGHKSKVQHGTQFPSCYIVFNNDARFLSNNIRE